MLFNFLQKGVFCKQDAKRRSGHFSESGDPRCVEASSSVEEEEGGLESSDTCTLIAHNNYIS
jgi:hypothetical protein